MAGNFHEPFSQAVRRRASGLVTEPNLQLACRPLSLHDVDALHGLHAFVVASASSKAFLTERDRSWFASVINGDGHAIGLFDDRKLIGYSILLHPPPCVDGLKSALKGLGLDQREVAYSGGMAIDPGYQGRGLAGRLLQEEINLAKSIGAGFVAGSIFPSNLAILKNLARNGSCLIGIHVDKDGENFLHLQSVMVERMPMSGQGQYHELANWPEHLAMLRKGKCIAVPLRSGEPLAYTYQNTATAGRRLNSTKTTGGGK